MTEGTSCKESILISNTGKIITKEKYYEKGSCIWE